MSKKYTTSFESLLKIKPSQLESMTRRDLAQAVTRMRDAGQKRLKRIEKSGIYSPSAEYIKRTGGFESVKNKSVEELRNQYIRLKGFLSNKTSTVTGAREYQKGQKKVIADQLNTTVKNLDTQLSEEDYGRIWTLIDRAEDSKIINRLRYKEYVGLARRIIAEETRRAEYKPRTKEEKEDYMDSLYEKFSQAITKAYQEEIETDETNDLPSKYFPK